MKEASVSYPIVDLTKARELRDRLAEARSSGAAISEVAWALDEFSPDHYVQSRGEVRFDLSLLEEVSREHFEHWEKVLGDRQNLLLAQQYELEASMAGPIHAALRDAPIEVLADRDFWRYLHLFPLRWYLLMREPEMQPQDYGGKESDRKYWLLIRTFLWGAMAYDPSESIGDPYRRATAVAEAGMREMNRPGMVVDFWHSHLIRRYFAVTPAVARAFIDEATTSPVALGDDARKLARRMTRLSRTVSLALADEPSARALVHEQKTRLIEGRQP